MRKPIYLLAALGALAIPTTALGAGRAEISFLATAHAVSPRRAALADRQWESNVTGLPISSAAARCQIEPGFTLCYGQQCAAWFSNVPGKFWARYTDRVVWSGQQITVRPGGVTFGSTC